MPDATEALTGSASTSEQGTATPGAIVRLQSLKIQQPITATQALSGSSITASQGAFGKTRTRALTGSAFTAQQGFTLVQGTAPAQQYIPADEFYPAEGAATNGGGVTGTEVHRTNLRWKNINGDFAGTGAGGVGDVIQGGNPFGSVALSSGAGGTITITVTTLVQRWVNGTHENHGFFLRRTSASGLTTFHSRQATTVANRPTLTVTVGGTPTTLNCESDSGLSFQTTPTNIVNANGALVTFNVGTGGAILRFDLSSISGTVQSATLNLTISSTNANTIGAFRVDLDHFQAPIPYETGVADSYPFDEGLGGDSNVVMYEDFSDLTLGMSAASNTVLAGRGWTGVLNSFTPPAQRSAGNFRLGDEVNASCIGDSDPDDPNYFPLFPGTKCIKFRIGHLGAEGVRLGNALAWRWPLYGNLGPIWESYNVARGALQDANGTHYPEEPEEIHIRCYFMFGHWDPLPQGGKWINGIDATYNNEGSGGNGIAGYPTLKPNAPPFTGNGGLKPFTCGGWSLRMHFQTLPTAGIDTPLLTARWRRIQAEAEDWSSVERGFANSASVRFNSLGFVKEYTWHCHDTRIKLNTIDTTGATKAYVGYPWGGLYSNLQGTGAGEAANGVPSGMPVIGAIGASGTCGTTGTNSTIVLTGGSSTNNFYNNWAVRIASRPSEIRRVTAYNGTTKVATIASHDGSSATWTNIPQSGEPWEGIQNTSVKERTTLYYGNSRGRIYADGNSVLGVDSSPVDTAILQSPGIGRKDGIRQVRIDGRLAMSETNVWFRSIPNVQIQGLWYPPFMGGSNVIPDEEIWCYFTHVVASKSYVGPARTTTVTPPTNVPSWVTNLPLLTQYEIPNTNLENNYPLSSKNFPGTSADNVAALGCESGLVVRAADSRIISSLAGGHGDWSGNITISKTLETETPGGMWEVDHPGSDVSVIPTSSPFAVLTHYSDGLPVSCHTYDRNFFLQAEDRLVRMQAPATWGANTTVNSCDSFDWATKTWAPAGTIPNLPIDEAASGAINAASCKDPLTEDIYHWWTTQIWKWTRDGSESGSWSLWAQLSGLNQKTGSQTSMASNGSELVVVTGTTGEVQVVNLATKQYSKHTITGSGAAGFQNVGTRCVIDWDPDINKYLFMPGNQSANRSTIYTLQNQSGTWVGEALITITPALPSYLGPAKRLVRIPNLKGWVFAQGGSTNLKFFRVA